MMTRFDFQAAIDFNLGTPLIYLAFVFIALRSIIPRIIDGKEIEVPKPAYNLWLISSIVVFGVMAWERVLSHLM